MKRVNGIYAHDQEADLYDEQVREYESYAHDVLFGMSFEYVRSGERLLDLGIGTGLASLPFAKLGLEVFGLDGSAETSRHYNFAIRKTQNCPFGLSFPHTFG